MEGIVDLEKVSLERREILRKISEYEKNGWFDKDVENDPPAPELTPEKADYLCEKPSNKIARRVANFIGDKYYQGLIKKGKLIIDGMEGAEYLSVLEKGAVIICNHFSAYDNYIVYECIRKHLPHKYLYKVIREGNYTNFPGLYGFLFRHCDTLPLSSNRRTMMKFTSAVNTLLKRGESILIYPEQAMWWNYRGVRPFKVGAFKLAFRAGVPVLPIFISMRHDEWKLDENGYPVQRHTVHILPPVYPNGSAEETCEKAYSLCKEKCGQVYGK
jgi:1-acyl-sn-glycerol-3-phosphate acyltransferase